MIHPSLIAKAWLQCNPLFLDTETTGLGEDAEIVEIAILGPPDIDFQSLIRPSRSIPHEATNVHGIADPDVADAPSFFELQDTIEHLLAGRVVVIYNAQYDVRMLHQSANAVGRSLFCDAPPGAIPNYRCAMELYATLRGEIHPIYKTPKWVSLQHAITECAIQLVHPDHDAYGDTLACKSLLHHIAGIAP